MTAAISAGPLAAQDDPATREIVICTEYIDYLAEQAP
jgi:hypothetical protein